jgi:hypothetical protein
MLLVSVGTGAALKANAFLDPDNLNLVYNMASVPAALTFAALNEQDMLSRVFGDRRHGEPLDREIGTLIGAGGPPTRSSTCTCATTRSCLGTGR